MLANPLLLELVVQPILDVGDLSVAGYEALSRVPADWGVNPETLFATAGELGVSQDLSLIVMRRALVIRDRLPARTFLSVNCAPADFVDDRIGELIGESDLTRVVVELTESAWPDDERRLLDRVALVRERGGHIAIDDVGSGYAGLTQLVRLRPDFVKVDRSLVRDLTGDPAVAATVRMLGELASMVDAWLVVEGVETTAQLTVLAQMGVPMVQGFLVARPGAPWPGCDVTSVEQVGAVRASGLSRSGREPQLGEVETDASGRPLRIRQLRARHDFGTAMTMSADTDPAVALRRALARTDPAGRFTPICLTDERGELTGVVGIDDLCLMVLDAASPTATPASS